MGTVSAANSNVFDLTMDSIVHHLVDAIVELIG
jgi:hypothetical protein